MGYRSFSTSLLVSCLLLSGRSLAITLDCSRVPLGKSIYDLSELKGPKAVHWVQWQDPSISNMTFTIDICAPLEAGREHDKCSAGARICGVETTYNTVHNTTEVLHVIPIAGEFPFGDGGHLDPIVTRLKGGSSDTDAEKDGIRIELHGGKYSGKKQAAIIKMICDPEKSGNEGFEKGETSVKSHNVDGLEGRGDEKDDDADKKPELPEYDTGKSLQFGSYGPGQDNTMLLSMTWRSKYACERADQKEPGDKNRPSGWGFFTWFLIIVFLLIASYIIFGSWLNYNRYGARGWDLVPHGDFIRDLPYIAKDWASNVNERIRGSSLRGGYSAV